MYCSDAQVSFLERQTRKNVFVEKTFVFLRSYTEQNEKEMKRKWKEKQPTMW